MKQREKLRQTLRAIAEDNQGTWITYHDIFDQLNQRGHFTLFMNNRVLACFFRQLTDVHVHRKLITVENQAITKMRFEVNT
jgi:hypothetical protein